MTPVRLVRHPWATCALVAHDDGRCVQVQAPVSDHPPSGDGTWSTFLGLHLGTYRLSHWYPSRVVPRPESKEEDGRCVVVHQGSSITRASVYHSYLDRQGLDRPRWWLHLVFDPSWVDHRRSRTLPLRSYRVVVGLLWKVLYSGVPFGRGRTRLGLRRPDSGRDRVTCPVPSLPPSSPGPLGSREKTGPNVFSDHGVHIVHG